MKSFTSSRSRILLALVAALLLSGCLTTIDVRHAVDRANYEMLIGEAGSPTDFLPANAIERGQPSSALARLDAFEQQLTDNPTALNALRLRRALLHLNNKAYALAAAAFDDVKDTDKLSNRDRALFKVHSTMLWWWPLAPVNLPGVFAQQLPAAERHQAALRDTAKEPATPPETRDYLLEMRAWIGIKLAFDLADAGETRKRLADAVDPFVASFSPAELAQVATGITDLKTAHAFDATTRRVLRTQGMIEHIASRMAARSEGRRVTPNFEKEQIAKYYATALGHALNP
jgi:hypothetical protein